MSIVGEDMEQLKFPYMADRNANWYNRFGKKYNLASYLSCGKEQIDWLQCFGFQL